MQIKIPGTTLKKIGQEETVWLCLSLTEKKRKVSADDLLTK